MQSKTRRIGGDAFRTTLPIILLGARSRRRLGNIGQIVLIQQRQFFVSRNQLIIWAHLSSKLWKRSIGLILDRILKCFTSKTETLLQRPEFTTRENEQEETELRPHIERIELLYIEDKNADAEAQGNEHEETDFGPAELLYSENTDVDAEKNGVYSTRR